VATTSTKSPPVVKADIRRVLDRMQVLYRVTKTGFDCIHVPSIDLSSIDSPTVSPLPMGQVDRDIFESMENNKLSVRFNINVVKVGPAFLMACMSCLHSCT
jgi:hypothetical protein